MEKNYKILVDVCCGVCFCGVFEQLKNKYDITAYWHNANIFPKTEHSKRLDSFVSANKQLNIIIDNNNWLKNHKKWLEKIEMNKFAKEPEGGKRCLLCYEYRLNKAAQFAKNHNFDFFASTLTISPHKNAEKINKIGLIIENNILGHNKNNKPKFFSANFKKNDGFKIANQISKQKNIYRQNYCGCEFQFP